MAIIVVAAVLDLFVLLLTLSKTYKHVQEARRLELPMGVAEVLLRDGQFDFIMQVLYVKYLHTFCLFLPPLYRNRILHVSNNECDQPPLFHYAYYNNIVLFLLLR